MAATSGGRDPPEPAPAAAGTWEVMLGGSYKAYDDPAVQSTLEAAYELGDATAEVTVRGTVYEVTLQGGRLQQRQKNDPTRTRKVRRVAGVAGSAGCWISDLGPVALGCSVSNKSLL